MMEDDMRLTWPRTRFVGAMLVALMAAGCGADAGTQGEDPPSESEAASPVPSTPEGWERFESVDGGFAISLPRGWEAADLSSGDIDDIVEFLRQDPQTAPMADQMPALLEQGVAFFAISADAESLAEGFATNLNIIVQPDVGMSQDLFVGANISFIEDTFDIDVVREDVQLPIGEAARVDWERPASAPPPVHTTQYYVVVDDRALIATFSRVAADEFADLEEEFADIIATLEVLP
jgi:hypothetical protein